MKIIIAYFLLGLVSGSLSGLIGIGGGVLIVPALIYLFGFSQHQAQGTTLAILVPPIGVFAAWAYYKQGFVDIRVAAFIAVGFIIGSWMSARNVSNISNELLEKIFGIVIVIIGLKMIVGK